MTLLCFLWLVGPVRCITVINTEPMHCCKFLFFTALCVGVHACIFVTTDTISDLMFPTASSHAPLYHGPRYLQQLLQYMKLRHPGHSGASFGSWASWCIVSAVVFSSAVWKEFLFRGVYFGDLRTRMPLWKANLTTSVIYALAHEPLQVSSDGAITLYVVSCAPMLMGALWYGYLYHKCNNLVVLVLAHLLFNVGLFAVHLSKRLSETYQAMVGLSSTVDAMRSIAQADTPMKERSQHEDRSCLLQT
eukprot:CAMPEP_0183516892 /NCGR_PEP_ID=MMETSP0371-20130417/14516_1 /TAXON_ID=268820 /ORGANISM="Peridinium aciculiferum, Strain PAER-2" /LENGTH=246 /DNA_ID=CAMNT_0025714691 /DNA_START=29 /DNA_END=767 /DNA_ORIENTATION=-